MLVSLPAHERPDIVAAQIGNLRHFAPGALVCVHVSPVFTGDIAEFAALESVPGVFVNRARLSTGRATGLFHVHVANFLYTLGLGEGFDKVLCISSNELLIRQGLEAHVARHVLGAQIEMFDPALDWHLFRRGLERDAQLMALLRDLGLSCFFGGQAEGQFYEAALFAEMENLYLRHFALAPCGFESEEILPQTMAMALIGDRTKMPPPVTFQNYGHFLELTPAVIEKIRTGGPGIIFAPKRPHGLRSPHIGVQNLDMVFSLKRIPREASPLRDYIHGLDREPAELAPA